MRPWPNGKAPGFHPGEASSTLAGRSKVLPSARGQVKTEGIRAFKTRARPTGEAKICQVFTCGFDSRCPLYDAQHWSVLRGLQNRYGPVRSRGASPTHALAVGRSNVPSKHVWPGSTPGGSATSHSSSGPGMPPLTRPTRVRIPHATLTCPCRRIRCRRYERWLRRFDTFRGRHLYCSRRRIRRCPSEGRFEGSTPSGSAAGIGQRKTTGLIPRRASEPGSIPGPAISCTIGWCNVP